MTTMHPKCIPTWLTNRMSKRPETSALRPRSLAPGTEYMLHDAQEPHLFVIRKQHRASATAVASPPHAFYYILDGSVYQVDSVAACSWSMKSACLYTGETLSGSCAL